MEGYLLKITSFFKKENFLSGRLLRLSGRRGFALRGRQGFSLIGVMVASTIGLIVVMGMSQMFANMTSQIKSIENQVKRVFFVNFIGDELNKNCTDTLQAGSDSPNTPNLTLAKPRTGTGLTFDQLKKKLREGVDPPVGHKPKSFNGHRIMKKYGTAYRSILDLVSEEDRLESEYGLSKGSYFSFECLEDIDPPHGHTIPHPQPPTHNHSSHCNIVCSSGPCEKKWRISLVTRREVNGVWILDKPYVFETNIRFNDNNTPGDLTDDLPECGNVTLVSPGPPGPGGSSDPYVLVESSKQQTIIGYQSSGSISSTVQGHTAYGYNVGTRGRFNTFMGYTAGKDTTGGNNTFIGYQAGESNAGGDHNNFFGRSAGENNSTGSYNTFTGSNAGLNNDTGKNNSFLGYNSGKDNTTGENNTLIGYGAGLTNTSGEDNVFVGHNAGNGNVSGTNNIFIGSESGNQTPGTNNHLVIGNPNPSNPSSQPQSWLVADMRTPNINVTTLEQIRVGGRRNMSLLRTRQVCLSHDPTNSGVRSGTNCPTQINGVDICRADGTGCPSPAPPSSITLKKNIKPFKKFQKALEDILKTPLFTYQYKDKKKYHPKKRMGVIAEELPKNLQIKEKGKVSRPDWPSIYGTLWGAIKALYEMIQDKEKRIDELSNEVKRLKEQTNELSNEIKSLKKEREENLKKIEKRFNDIDAQLSKTDHSEPHIEASPVSGELKPSQTE